MNKKKKMSDRNRTFLLITIPILLLFFCFNTLPLLKGFLYSFTNFKGYGSYDFVKLRNYIDLFQDARVGKSYLFTFKFALVSTILVNVLSLILALGLNSRIKGKSALRGIYFIPNVLGGLVVGYIFSYLFTYILPALGQAAGNRSPEHQPFVRNRNSLVCYCAGMLLAVDSHEYHHLYIRAADRSRGCV